MPRSRIELAEKVEYLSILDEHGRVDEALDPHLDEAVLRRMFRLMLTTRRLDERLINLQRQGRLGTYGPSRGQEAAQVGTALTIGPDDWTAQSFRELGLCLTRGWAMEMLMLFWGGREEGNVVPAGVNDLPMAVPVASQLIHGVGIAWAMKIKGRTTVCLTYSGDGGTSEGDFHEALNFAGVFQLPVIFIVQNNQFAISLPRGRQTRSATLAQKATAYGFDGLQVDGNDVLAVYAGASEAVARARSGGGPTLLECVTYRLSVHTTADDPSRYRSAEEVRTWEGRDPLHRFSRYLRDRGLLDDTAMAGLEAEIQEDIRQAVARYEAWDPADLLDPFKYLYATPPVELAEQAEEFAAALRAEGLDRARRGPA